MSGSDMQYDALRLDTLAVHAGQRPDAVTGARAVPIYQTTSYVFEDVDSAAALFDLQAPGYIYSRIANPTVAVFEERVSALEGGVAAIATASGQAALHLAIATLAGAGNHVVASRALYGGTHQVLAQTLPRFEITTTFVSARDPDSVQDAIRPETRVVLAETIGNPMSDIADIARLAEIAHAAGVPLLLDNTFATPILCRPFDWGADLVFHSATKFIGGHGAAIGGVLVDSGRFDWEAAGTFPTLTEPYAGYHGIDFCEEFGPLAFAMRARTEGLRDFGACLAPQNAFLFLLGLETLPVRMARHVANALAIARFLERHDAVAWVSHPGLPSHPDHALAAHYLPDGAGAVFAFGIRGGRAAGARFIEALSLFSHLANVGDAKSLVIHPASTTHRQLSDAELAAAGVGEDLVRLSVGLEDAADLQRDLDRALVRSQRA